VSSVSTQKALTEDLSGRTLNTTPLYGTPESAVPVTHGMNSTNRQPHENGATSFPQGTINVMAPAPIDGPGDAKPYDSVNALANAAAGHFVGALIINAFLDQDRARQGLAPMVKASKDGVIVSLNWSF